MYAKDPHDLTHDPDSLRYFCVWWTIPADSPEEIDRRRNNWRPDLLEDYETADDEIRAMMVKSMESHIMRMFRKMKNMIMNPKQAKN